MNEIAQDTFDYERCKTSVHMLTRLIFVLTQYSYLNQSAVLIVTKLMWEAIENQRPAAWRVIFKGLTLTEHLVKNGSERCVDDARNHSHLLRSLDRFNYYEGTVDRGVGVREKAKQLVDILGDDERIREERMKARQLREKFAGRGGSATNSSGGGGSKYAGYGNSDAGWNTGGSKGYGESGIGSGSGTDTRFAGRYGEGGIGSSGSSKPNATMASDVPKKSSKVKKVKKKEKAPAPGESMLYSDGIRYISIQSDHVYCCSFLAAPEVDLFSFDDAPATTPSQPVNNTFDAFQTAPAANDDFGDFQEIAPTAPVQFDAFGTSAAAPTSQQGGFDAFGGSTNTMNTMQQNQGMMGNQQMGANMNAMNNAFGNMNVQSQQMPTATLAAPTGGDDDDFGDFADAEPSAAKTPAKSSDPLSSLISLDGLTKNVKKEKTADEPVVNQTNPQMGMNNMNQPMPA